LEVVETRFCNQWRLPPLIFFIFIYSHRNTYLLWLTTSPSQHPHTFISLKIHTESFGRWSQIYVCMSSPIRISIHFLLVNLVFSLVWISIAFMRKNAMIPLVFWKAPFEIWVRDGVGQQNHMKKTKGVEDSWTEWKKQKLGRR